MKKDFRLTGKMRTVLFHRHGFFYPLDLPANDDLAEHARCNTGTIKITDGLTGKVLWQHKPEVVVSQPPVRKKEGE